MSVFGGKNPCTNCQSDTPPCKGSGSDLCEECYAFLAFENGREEGIAQGRALEEAERRPVVIAADEMGYARGLERGRALERSAIAAFIRYDAPNIQSNIPDLPDMVRDYLFLLTEEIERGEHAKEGA